MKPSLKYNQSAVISRVQRLLSDIPSGFASESPTVYPSRIVKRGLSGRVILKTAFGRTILTNTRKQTAPPQNKVGNRAFSERDCLFRNPDELPLPEAFFNSHTFFQERPEEGRPHATEIDHARVQCLIKEEPAVWLTMNIGLG